MTQPDSNWLDQYKHVVVNLQMTIEETLSLVALLSMALSSTPVSQDEAISIDLANITIALSALNGKALSKVTPMPQPCMIGLATYGAYKLAGEHAMEGIVRQAMDKLESDLTGKPAE